MHSVTQSEPAVSPLQFCMRCGQFVGNRERPRFCPRCGMALWTPPPAEGDEADGAVEQTRVDIALPPSDTPPDELVPPLPVAGFQYYDGPLWWNRMAVGQELTLVRDPDNRFDRWAVEIHWSGDRKIGYVPRYVSESVGRILDSGQELRAWICRKTPGRRFGYHSLHFQLDLPLGHQLWKWAE